MPSREVASLIGFVEAADLAHRVTSTVNHSRLTAAGYLSRHRMDGTNGEGLAVDFAGPAPGDVKAMLAIWRAFLPRFADIHELIFWAPGVDTLVRRKLKVVPMTYGRDTLLAHRNHVHVSVNKGTFLVPPTRLAAPLAPLRFTDYAAGEDQMRRYVVEIALDDKGNGYTEPPLDIPPDRVLSLLAHGPYPKVDGYWNLPALGSQDREGKTVVTATEGPPGGKVLVAVWTLG